MTNNYISSLLEDFDKEFESLVIPFPKENIVADNIMDLFSLDSLYEETEEDTMLETADVSGLDANTRLSRIEDLATKISAERYNPNYNPEICLANLLDLILTDGVSEREEDNFFELLNKERNLKLNEVLSDFDFFNDNPYKEKAEKILSKIEARKNK